MANEVPHTSASSSGAVAQDGPASPAATTTGTKVFHPKHGREDCLVCHSSARVGAVLMPVDHVAQVGGQCATCHVRAGGPLEAVYGGGAVMGLVFAVGAGVLWRRVRGRRPCA